MIDSIKRYCTVFKEQRGSALISVRSPGRVNLLGAHTDYSGGMVLPGAVNYAVRLVGRARPDDLARIYSRAYNTTVQFSVDRFRKSSVISWVNYIKGVVYYFRRYVNRIPGFQLMIDGDLPRETGMGSSAALETALAVFLQNITGIALEPVETAQLAREAENKYVGVQCGIMDQMASALGRKNKVILINCGTLRYRYVSWHEDAASIILVDTFKRRSLVNSEFNYRKTLVKRGMEIFSEINPSFRQSSSITIDDYKDHRKLLPKPVVPLMQHIIYENQRVRDGAQALEQGNMNRFGELMFESYYSSRTLFRTTIPELDFIAECAQKNEGVFGTKLMGGGFGGAVAVATSSEAQNSFINGISHNFENRFGYRPGILKCKLSNGVSIVVNNFQ